MSFERLTDEELNMAIGVRQDLMAGELADVANNLRTIDEEGDDIDDLKNLEDALADLQLVEDTINSSKWLLEELIAKVKARRSNEEKSG